MKKKGFQNCLLCGSGRWRAIFSYNTPDKYELAVGVVRDNYFRKWVKCSNCGFYYSIYSRPQKILDKLYSAGYRDKNASWRTELPEKTFRRITALSKGKSETKFRVTWIKSAIEDSWDHGLIAKSRLPYRVLDIGGGAGIFAYEFQDTRWKTYVVDPDKKSSFIKTKLHIPLVQSFYRPKLFNRKFTLISLNYVLEHIADPISFLKSVRRDMSESSFLYIEVPDALCFHFKPKNDDIFNACHLWMFTPDTLAVLLNRCGFEILTLSRIKAMRGHYALMALAGPKSF